MKKNGGTSSLTIGRIGTLIVVLLVGCDKNSTSPTTGVRNTPVAVSVANSFTYTLDANGYSANSGYDLSFSSDSLVYTMVVSGFSSGSATVTINNLTGGLALHDSVYSNMVNTIIQSGTGIPNHCTLAFQNFTGKFSLVLAKYQATH